MQFSIRSGFSAVAILATCVGTIITFSHGQFDIAFNPSPTPSEGPTNLETDHAMERTGRRVAMKDCVVRDLIEGRVTMEEATETFMELNSLPPQVTTDDLGLSGINEMHATAQQIVLLAEFMLDRSSDPRPEVRDRIHNEFAELCCTIEAEETAASAEIDE